MGGLLSIAHEGELNSIRHCFIIAFQSSGGWHTILGPVLVTKYPFYFSSSYLTDFPYWTSMQILKFDSDLFNSFEWQSLSRSVYPLYLAREFIDSEEEGQPSFEIDSSNWNTWKITIKNEWRKMSRKTVINIRKYWVNFSNISKLFRCPEMAHSLPNFDKSVKLRYGKGVGREFR